MSTQFSLNYKIHSNQIWAILLVTICSLVLIKIITPLDSEIKSFQFWRYLIFDLIWCIVLILFILKQVLLFGKSELQTKNELDNIEDTISQYDFHLFENNDDLKVFRRNLDGNIKSYQDLIIKKQSENFDNKPDYFFVLNSYTFVDICLFTHHFSDLKLLQLI